MTFAIVLLALCGAWYLLPLREWLEALRSGLRGLGAWGVVAFVLAIVAITFLPAPDWPLPIAAGYIYGVWAFPLMFLSTTAAATLVFLISRHLVGDRVRAILRRRRKYRAIDKAVEAEGWKIVVLVRLSPFVPFNLQNYAFGVTAVPTLEYTAATFAGIIPGTALYVYFGIFGKGLGGPVGTLDWVLLGLGVAATIALAILVTRKTKEKLKW